MGSDGENDRKPPHSQQHEPSPPNQGYPPPPYQGYGPPPPYPVYPNSYPYNSGQHPPPPNAAYYPPPQHYIPNNPERSNGYTCIRLLLVLVIILFVGMSLMSLITFLIFGSDIPSFHVESLQMPVANVTNSTLFGAKWDVNLTVTNPNKKMEIYFDNTETNLLYKDYLLATSFVEPFQVQPSQKHKINSSFEMKEYTKNVAAGLMVKEMEEKDTHAAVVFDMAVSTTAAYKSESSLRKKVNLKILCVDLELVFPSGVPGSGVWRGENLKDCYVWA